MTVISCIKKDFADTVIPRCSEMGCKLKLNNLNSHVVLKGESICHNRKICDCIIFARDNPVIIGIIELKSRNIHSSEIEEKLTNGSEIALDILKKYCDNDTKFEFYHIALCKSWRSSEYKVIENKKIVVNGKKYDIILKKCGESFSMLISSLG